MPKSVGDTWLELAKGSEDDWITWRKGLLCVGLSVATAFFVTDETFYLILLAPAALLLAFILVEAWQREPRHGKFGRVGRLSRDELVKAQSKLRSRKT